MSPTLFFLKPNIFSIFHNRVGSQKNIFNGFYPSLAGQPEREPFPKRFDKIRKRFVGLL